MQFKEIAKTEEIAWKGEELGIMCKLAIRENLFIKTGNFC